MRAAPGTPRPLATVLAAALAAAAAAGCGTEDHVNVFHATFQADGAAKDLTTQVGFLNVVGYGVIYSEGGSSPVNLLAIDLPATASPGLVCTGGVSGCGLVYRDAANRFGGGNAGSTFQVTVTEWPGRGGYARGTFQASLVADSGPATVLLTAGRFEAFIHN